MPSKIGRSFCRYWYVEVIFDARSIGKSNCRCNIVGSNCRDADPRGEGWKPEGEGVGRGGGAARRNLQLTHVVFNSQHPGSCVVEAYINTYTLPFDKHTASATESVSVANDALSKAIHDEERAGSIASRTSSPRHPAGLAFPVASGCASQLSSSQPPKRSIITR